MNLKYNYKIYYNYNK